jgi:hypothetical protein
MGTERPGCYACFAPQLGASVIRKASMLGGARGRLVLHSNHSSAARRTDGHTGTGRLEIGRPDTRQQRTGRGRWHLPIRSGAPSRSAVC